MVAALTRPILTTLVDRFEFPIHIVIPTFITCLLIFTIVIVAHKIKLDIISIMILVFCVYSVSSYAWGTKTEPLARLLLPFVTFFAVRTFADDYKKVRLLLILLLIGYIVPVFFSAALIYKDASVTIIDYYSGLARQKGVFAHVHSLGHAMVFFSYIYACFIGEERFKGKLFNFILHVAFVLSVFSLYKSYVRSAYVGFLSFWLIFFIGRNKRYFLVLLLAIISYTLWDSVLSENFDTIFWKTSSRDLNEASSGRIEIWNHNLKVFVDSPFYSKLLGNGIGSETSSFLLGKYRIRSSHNDWLELIMAIGVMGLVIYIGIIIVLVRDIISSEIELNKKWYFISVIFSTGISSLITNGYIFRFEMSQIFWLLMGTFYSIRNSELKSNTNALSFKNAG